MKYLSLAAALLFLSSTVNSDAAASYQPDSDGIMIIEAEAMNLNEATIVEIAGASGGKGIKTLSEEASASIELRLPKGIYVAGVFLSAPDPEHDGIYLAANDKMKRTPAPWHDNQLVYGAKFLVFESNGVDPTKLHFASSWPGQEVKEYGMAIDHLEIVEYSKAPYRLEKWTD